MFVRWDLRVSPQFVKIFTKGQECKFLPPVDIILAAENHRTRNPLVQCRNGLPGRRANGFDIMAHGPEPRGAAIPVSLRIVADGNYPSHNGRLQNVPPLTLCKRRAVRADVNRSGANAEDAPHQMAPAAGIQAF